MNKNIFKIGAIVMMIAFISGFASGVAAVNGISQPSMTNGKASITTDNATISVTGGNNVPFYHIQAKGSNTTYEVKFVNMQEFIDKNNDSIFQNSEVVARSTTLFPGQNWNFSGFQTVNDSNNNIQMVNFNFTEGTAPHIALDNHVNVTAGNQIKFDLALSNYSWTSTNASAKLAIEMQIAGGNLTAGQNKNQLSFGNGYFNTVSQATSNGNTIAVTTQIASGNSFYLVFDHFNGNFSLDPTFGVQSTSSTSSTSTTTSSSASSSSSVASSTSSKTTPVALLPVLGSFAVVGIVVMKKRKST